MNKNLGVPGGQNIPSLDQKTELQLQEEERIKRHGKKYSDDFRRVLAAQKNLEQN